MGLTPASETGATHLPDLLAKLCPVLQAERFVFATCLPHDAPDLTNLAVATFRETEGISIVLRQEDADRLHVRYDAAWALITLQVYSALSAVGFLAALLPALAAAGISVNPVSAFHHDHLFVPWERRHEALQILQELSHGRSGRPDSEHQPAE